METSPYQTPESKLEPAYQLRRSIWWKIYFFFITALSVVGMGSLLSDPAAGPAEYASLTIWLIATTGLFGFVFSKPVYKPKFWFGTLVIYLIFSFSYFFITNIDLRMGMSDTEFYLSNFIGILFSLPMYYALYAFSRPDNPVWNNA